ncbi:hypothetical protein BDP81DRAFT_481135 [Colletotrichum phormii]|uniref:Peptidase S8/S53 domain-containing protein n=1 Tax=Colletotrichum phormii TaxID=359342 RepID=A0AAI9ZQP8_9PEZI|nr:uncharacterized protein BDP81DRAFT_481135 [Colletotrichum phormii]KAK1636424.1 hypothetical protein BDP81DRAFT_481135 [Colletotrichum phormii]
MLDDETRGLGPESDDEEEYSDEEDDITSQTRHAIADMKTNFNSQATQDTIDQFLFDHRVVVSHVGQNGVTFFHKIVQLVDDKDNENSLTASSIKPLFETLVKRYPDLLRYKDQEGQTALYRAIKLKRHTWKLVDYILNSLLRNLVAKAGETALGLSDGSHRTPMHYAVQYKQCTDQRVQVIKLLLDKDAEIVRNNNSSGTVRPFRTFLDETYLRKEEGKQDEVEYSVYGEQERTAKAYLKALEEERDTKGRNAEKDRTDVKEAAGTNLATKDKEPPKPVPPKELKSQAGGERDRAGRRTLPDREQPKQASASLVSKLDESDRIRLELREKEEREHQERRSREERKQRERASERDGNRPRQSKDQKDRLDESTGDLPKIHVTTNGAEHTPNTPLKRVATQRLDVTVEAILLYGCEEGEEGAGFVQEGIQKDRPRSLAKNSAQILRMLKLRDMRTRSIKMATSFLYGKNIREDIQICFDYEGLPSEIQDHVFMERFGADRDSGIRFDEVLMHVRFPTVAVKRTGRRAPKPRALGRQDMEFFFEWLNNKGVRRILNDESIQNSLEKIVVEHLDWQKTDLDPRIICHVRNTTAEDETSETVRVDLREVTLKWSGNNVVLRSWSEVSGLSKLPKLEVIHLNVPAQDWVRMNIDDFGARLNTNANDARNDNSRSEEPGSNTSQVSEVSMEQLATTADSKPPAGRKIVVFPRDGKKGTDIPMPFSGVPKPARSNPVTEHDWLNCTERFGGCMDGVSDVLQSPGKDVVVALIDDGVDCCDATFSGRVIEGKTFDYQDRSVGQYYISAKGHGTEMSRMILKVCPMASIYSIRLKTHTSPDKGLSTIDAVSAALAIEAALEKNATIISMSWTLPVPSEGSEEKRLLYLVLERACNQNVLMFCSSPDQISAAPHYPSAFRRSRFFLIGAAHDDGSVYGHAGKNNDFIFPGVNVNTSSGSESTGSSIATALAAGLAAMITYCFKASALGSFMARMQQGEDHVAGPELASVHPDDVNRIAQHTILKTAFHRLGKMENGQFIEVWKRFQTASQILEGENKYEEKLSCITKLCSNLIEH